MTIPKSVCPAYIHIRDDAYCLYVQYISCNVKHPANSITSWRLWSIASYITEKRFM